MSIRLSSKHWALLREEARLLVSHTGEHRHQLHTLVASAVRDLHDMEVSAVVQASISAEEQHAAACQLLAALDGHHRVGRQRANAVLVVDDYKVVRQMVARVLRDAGFVVRTAANGLEGLIAATQMRPRVIIMDVSMPVLDGIEATRLLKAREATRAARVIAYTANASIDGSLLFDAVLRKPALPEVVLATVRHVAGLDDIESPAPSAS